MFRRGIGGENLDIMKRDDKRSPQVTDLCLRALAGKRGGGLGSPAHCARFYFGSHVFGLYLDVCRQSRTLRRSGAKVETDL